MVTALFVSSESSEKSHPPCLADLNQSIFSSIDLIFNGIHMKSHDDKLVRHLIIFVLLKLCALVVLWWLFVKDAKVNVNADSVFEKISSQQKQEESPK